MPKRIASLVLAAVGGLILGIAVMTAAASLTAAPKLTSQDYNDIHSLYARYAHAFDKTDAEMYGNVFTADGEFVIGERVLKGRKEIASLTAAFGPMKTRPKVFHVNSNVLIEPSQEGAKGSAYILLMDLSKNPAITGGGIYEDVIVKTAEGWRFKRRTYFAEPGPASATQASSR
jgi:uncharacterized protein (TIGR02246 family)